MDFNSPDGMISSTWGPAIWHFLHTVSFNYPVSPTQKQKKEYTQLILTVGKTLPCKYCRDNFTQNIHDVPITAYALQNRNTFSRWVYRFHNHINKMLGKPVTVSYNEVRDKYNRFRANCSSKKGKKKECSSSKYTQKCTIIMTRH